MRFVNNLVLREHCRLLFKTYYEYFHIELDQNKLSAPPKNAFPVWNRYESVLRRKWKQ